MSRILITLCTYNERDNIALLIPELLQTVPDAAVLVIDDNSPDGTGQLADQLAADDDRVRHLARPGKLGLGSATLAGFHYGIQHQFELLVNMDADFSHQPCHIPEMLRQVHLADVIIGSRYVNGGGVEGWTLRRRIMSQMINALARIVLGLRTYDNSGSFRCYRVSSLQRIDWKRTVSRGYAFQEEVLYRCARAGCRFIESPIRFQDRRFGQTKINVYESITAVRDILWLGLHRILRRRVLIDPPLPEQSQDTKS